MEEMRAIRKKTRELHRVLKEELDKPGSDKDKISGLTGELKELHGKQLQAMVDRVTNMKQILTPEQYKKMNEIMNNKMKKMNRKMNKQGLRGGPEDMHEPGDKSGMRGKASCDDEPCPEMPL